MKLELKHLAPYLPYGLKVFRDTGETSEILELSSGKIMLWEDGYYEYFKPILRPLSDLTKEIEHNGEKFVPIDLLEVEGYVIGWNGFGITMGQEEGYSFGYAMDVHNNIIQKLLEWHFDINNLIDQGLAIDINTLK